MKSVAARLILALLAYLAALVLVALVCAGLVLLVAGPHAGLLPGWLEVVCLALGWLLVLLVPLWVARKVWNRCGQTPARPVEFPASDSS